MGKDKKSVTTEVIVIDVPRDTPAEVRAMFMTYKQAWSGKVGEINVTEMRIGLIPYAKTFKSPPFRAGPKTLDIERAEINKQLKLGVIELDMSAFSTPILFVTKKDGKLQLFTYCRALNSIADKKTYPSPRMDDVYRYTS